jgi:hypothetical protein
LGLVPKDEKKPNNIKDGATPKNAAIIDKLIAQNLESAQGEEAGQDAKSKQEKPEDRWKFAESVTGEVSVLVNDTKPGLKFEVALYHNDESHLEEIGITAVLDGEYNRSSQEKVPIRIHKRTDIFSFDKTLNSFKQYGVILDGSKIFDIRRLVERNYNKIARSVVPETEKEELSIAVSLLFGYIYGEDGDDEKKEADKCEFEYIPTKEFAKQIAESDLSGADVIGIRRMLKKAGILQGTGNRTDVLHRNDGKVERVIKIDLAKLKAYKLPE